MNPLYKWQKITLWIVGILTFISVTFAMNREEFNIISYLLYLIVTIALNIFIFFLIFQFGNWIYLKTKK